MINIKVCDQAPETGCSYYRSIGVLSKLKHLKSDIKLEHLSSVGWNNLVDADILFLERPSDDNYLKAIQYAKNVDVPVWIDFDDFFHGIPDYNPCKEMFDKNSLDCVIKSIKLADVVTVATQALKDQYKKFNDNIVVVPNAFNDYIFRFEKSEIQNNIINWRGSKTHLGDLCSCAINMFELSKKYHSWVFNFQGSAIDLITNGMFRCSQQNETDIISYFKNLKKMAPAIMQVPLAFNEFNSSKSNIAWIVATWAGAAVLAPDMPEFNKPGILNYTNKINSKIKVEYFENIYLYNESYGYSLEKLIKSKELRKKNYIESFEYIKENLLLSNVNKQRLEIIETLLSGGYKQNMKNTQIDESITVKDEENKDGKNLKIALITVIRNDHDLIEYFYKYWYKLGVTDFFVVLHLDTDDSIQHIIFEIAKEMKNSKFRIFKNDKIEHNHEVDCKVLSDTALSEGFDWILGCDIDELLILKKHKTIQEFLFNYDKDGFYSLHFQWNDYRIIEETPENCNPFTYIKYLQTEPREQTKAIGKFNDKMKYVPGIHYIEFSPEIININPEIACYVHFCDRNKKQFVQKYTIQHENWMRKYGEFKLHGEITENPNYLADIHWPNAFKSWLDKKENNELILKPLHESLFDLNVPSVLEFFPIFFPEMKLAKNYCKGFGVELGAAAHNSFGLENCINISPKDDQFYKDDQIKMCGKFTPIDKFGDAQNLPVENDSLDYIISSHVVEHIPDLIGAFLEWNRVLKDQGIVFIIVPKRDSLESDIGRPISTIDCFELGHEFPDRILNEDLHVWVFSLQILIELVDYCNAKYNLGWNILEDEETDSKVGNGHTIVCRRFK